MTAGYIAAPALAKRWGLKTGTLSKWRRLKKGPRGWYALSPTHVVYPLEEVERFEAERRNASGVPPVPAAAPATVPLVAAESPGKSPAEASACPHEEWLRHTTYDGFQRFRCRACGDLRDKDGGPQIECSARGATEPRMSEEVAR